MGCGTSAHGLPPAASGAVITRTASTWCHPSGALLKEWSAEEMEAWYCSLPIPGIQPFKAAVLGGMDGAFAADRWTEQLLVQAGLTGFQSMQLITSRDKAAAAATQMHPSASAVPELALPAKVPDLPIKAATVDAPKSKAKATAKKGIALFRLVLDKAGPMLPFPGAAGVLSGLSSLLGMVEDSMEVSENVAALQERSFDLLEVMVANSAALQSNNKDKAVRLLSNFNDILAEIILYATEYTGRNWLMKVFTSGGDSSHYAELQVRLQELVADATLGITADVRTQVAAILLRLNEPPAFVDQGAPARDLIKTYGGIAAVIADADRMDEVMLLVDPGQHINAMLIKQAIAIMGAVSEEGVHRLIKQVDMCVFWRKNFKMLPSVDWKLFWAAFPSELADNPMSPGQVELIQLALSSEAAHTQFQKHVAPADTVGVQDIKMTFLAQADLLATVQRLAGVDATSAGVSLPNSSLFRLPQPDALYSGRDEDALEAVQLLTTGRTLVCLVAQAGMGKSSLALDVGARMWRDGLIPGGARFVDMREARSKDAFLSRFSTALDLDEDGDMVSAIMTKLRHLSAVSAPVLLVVDNAEDPLQADPEVQLAFTTLMTQVYGLGQHRVQLLVTSRTELATQDDMPVLNRDLSKLSTPAAVRLITSIASDLSEEDAMTLAVVSRGNPLLLRLVASAMACGRMVMQDLHRDLHQPEDGAAADFVISAVHLMLSALPRQQQLALLQLSVFASGFDEDGAAAMMSVEPYRARGVIQVLHTHGLVMFDTARHKWLLHMAVKTTAQQVFANPSVMTGLQSSFVAYMMRQLIVWGAMYAKGGTTTQLALQLEREGHADTLAAFEHLSNTAAEAYVVDLVCDANQFCLDGLGMYSNQAFITTWKALMAQTTSASADRQQQARVLHCLAQSLRARGLYSEAEPVFRQALNIRTRVLGADHPDTMSSINSMASCLYSMGKTDEAEPMYRQTLEMRTRLLGAEHPDTMNSINNLANCLSAMGKIAEAEPMYRQTLEMRTRLLGAEHPSTVDSISNLASCLCSMGKIAEAEPMYRQALEMRTRLLGAEHPSTVNSISNLASCLSDMSKTAEAEPMFRLALEMNTRLLGPEYPITVTSITNLADCLCAMGNTAEAEPMYRQALEMNTRLLGPEHPSTLNSINNLAYCLCVMGKTAEAEPMYRQLLETRTRLLGAEHPDTVDSTNNLAICLQAMSSTA